MALDPRLLEILACPSCKGKLQYRSGATVLICRGERLAYPIIDGIPQLLDEQARPATEEELS